MTFTITSKVPDLAGYDSDDYYLFSFSDGMSSELYTNETIMELSVKVGSKECTLTEHTDGEDYINSNGDNKLPSGETWWYNVESMTAGDDEYTHLAVMGNMLNWQDYVGETITITYKARVNADSCKTDTPHNEVHLYYTDPAGDEGWSESADLVGVWSNLIDVTKTDGSSNVLKDAKFVLMNEDGEFLAENWADIDGDSEDEFSSISWNKAEGSNLGSDNLTVDASTIAALEASDAVTYKVSDEKGKLSFTGLEDGTYYLVEIEAPDGYNLLDKATVVTVAGTDYDTSAGANDGLKGYGLKIPDKHAVTVVNQSGTVLPSTGGMGTTLFYVIGGALVVAVAVLFITRRRMEAE